MLARSDRKQIEKDPSDRKLIINIHIEPYSDPEIRSCEVIGPNYRNRTSFTDKVRMQDVFTDAVAAGLRICLSKLSNITEVVSLPEFLVETPGLTLGGAHMVVTRVKDGTLHIICRFRIFLGGINRAFKPQIGFDSYVADENARLSMLVLADLAMPLQNLCNAVEMGMLNADAPSCNKRHPLTDRAHEIAFQIELVKRFVETANAPRSRPFSHPDDAANLAGPDDHRVLPA